METLNTKSKSLSIKTYIVFICLCVACFLVIMLLVISQIGGGAGGPIVQAIDDPIRFWFYGLRSPWLTSLVLPFTHSCDWYFIAGACVVLLIIPKSRIKVGIPVAAGSVVCTIINNPIKLLVKRPRPDDVIHLVSESSSSFPSGHAITSICFYGLLIVVTRRYIKNTAVKNILTVVFIIPMIGIGLSRIYCGVHFPTDVFAGWALGIATALAVYLIIIRRQKTV